MASGIEAAGLALATFSILLQFVEGYHTIKDAKNYKLTLKRLDRELGMEKCIFANTCRNFLKDIVSAEDVEAFVSGVGWGNLDFQERLKQHLGLENAKAFTEGVEALHESLQRLNQEVQLDGKQKKFKFAFSKSRQDTTLSEINRINTNLEKLALQQTRITTAQTSPQQSYAVESYNRIRNHARSLYSVFQEIFRSATCPCKGPHNASLRLQRVATEQKDRDGTTLKVLFDFEDIPAKRRDWRIFEVQMENLPEIVVNSPIDLDKEVESNPLPKQEPKRRAGVVIRFLVARGRSPMTGDESVTRTRRTVSVDDTTQEGAQQPVASTAAEIMAGKIGDLCLAIRQATVQSANVSSNSCIGVLVDERERVLHRIWPTAAESPYITEAVSLGTLLVPGLLEKGVRLKLGVQLASTVMQLHASEWLGENWGKQDIFFLQRSCQRRTADGMFLPILEPVVDRPFVRRNFGTSSEQKVSQAAAASALIEYNKSLFSLGVVLIELWFGQGIECLQHTTGDVLFNDNSIYQTAQQHIGELLAASENYGLAVSRCLSGLSRPMKTTDLNDRDFKNAVHEDVICLLEKNLEVYHDI